MILALILGSCINLEGFVWEVDVKYHDSVKLAYYIPVRIDDFESKKTVEILEKRTGTWKLSYVEKNATVADCKKLQKDLK